MSEFYDAFRKLEDFLRKAKKTEERYIGTGFFSTGFRDIEFIRSGDDRKSLNFYEFPNDVMLVREGHDFSGSSSCRTIHGPVRRESSHSWSKIYVIGKEGLIADEEKVKKAIKEATCVNLPEIRYKNWEGKYDEKEDSSEVITKYDIEKSESEIDTPETQFQPTDMGLSRQAYVVKKAIEKMPSEFGLRSVGEMAERIGDILAVANKIGKKYETKYNKAKKENGGLGVVFLDHSIE
jgi:hypothetical protein